MEGLQHTSADPEVLVPVVPADPTAQPTGVPPATSSASTTPLGSIARPSSSGSHTSHTPNSATPSVAAPSSPSPPTTAPATATASPVPTSPEPAVQNTNTQTQPFRKKSILSKLWALKAAFYALAIVALTDGLTLTAASTRSPLGSISYTKGVLVLSILQMLTGYSLAAAAQTAWDRVRFRMLSKRPRASQSLLVFWTLSTDIGGSCSILWNELGQWFRRRIRRSSRDLAAQTQPGLQADQRGHPKSWSITRIMSWAAMQFPGVIIMTIVNSTTSYVPIQWTFASGGIGRYDPNLATSNADPILVTNSVLGILQDTRRAVQIKPINSDCLKAGNSCKSFLVPGGLDAVSPWPYQKLKDTSLDVYVTKGEPAYQIDFWDPPDNVTIAKEACTVYAAGEDEGFQLCISAYTGGAGQIVAGWTPCLGTILASGECSQEGSWGAYIFFSTILSISRRTATVSMARDTGTILAWDDLGPPELQNIIATDFKTAFNVTIIPWHNSSSSTSAFDYPSLLTAQIASSLRYDLDAPASSRSWDLLHNLFATTLYVFNNVTLGVGPDIVTVQPNLLPENYINGSYGRTRIHAVPQRWTVLTYVAVSGILLLTIFLALALGAGHDIPESSAFPFVDSLILKWVVQGEQADGFDNMREAFQTVHNIGDGKILKQAAEIRVKLRSNIGGTV